MVIISLFSWWYSTGWLMLLQKCFDKIKDIMRFFSIGQLLTSLFAPFRQISAGKVNGPISVQFKAWADKTFSRFIGAFIRTFLIIFGLISVILSFIISVVFCLIWPLLPIAPVLCLLFVGALVQ